LLVELAVNLLNNRRSRRLVSVLRRDDEKSSKDDRGALPRRRVLLDELAVDAGKGCVFPRKKGVLLQ